MFDDYALRMLDGFPLKVDIWEVAGNATTDGNAAIEVLKEKGIDVPDLSDYTWHHVEDGTMMPVPSELNSTFSHTGGNSIVNNELF